MRRVERQPMRKVLHSAIWLWQDEWCIPTVSGSVLLAGQGQGWGREPQPNP